MAIEISEARIDAGGKVLREHDMAGWIITRPWGQLPISDKRKWLLKARLVLEAAAKVD